MARRRPKARPLAVTNAALHIGVKVMPWIPPWLKLLLAGGRKVTIDGNTLDATLQLMLAGQRISGTGGLGAAENVEIARALMRNHLAHCAAHAIRTGSAEERQAMYDELLGMIYKNAR